MVAETTLTARLLGIRVLRVDGIVLLSPASLDAAPLPPLPPRTSSQTSSPAVMGDVAVGGALERADRLLRDTDTRLRLLDPARDLSSTQAGPETPA